MAHVEPLREDDPAAVGPYRLLGRLGAGGQGTVYLGQAPEGPHVAVKVLREGAGHDDRLAKEIAAARRVEPFCIAQVLDVSLGARPYIVTEYVEGPSLQQAGRHSGADLQRLAVATATALAAIHQAGIVHRDFKPANVLLGPGGPRVIDFGIARAMDDALTHTSSIVGTPAYMAPEQLAGQPVGPPADVFAWASVMAWAANGTPPFGQDTLPAIINRILHNEPQLGELPHVLRSIVYDCLAKDPLARPTMRDVILRLLSGQNASTAPEPHRPDDVHAQAQDWRQGPGPVLGHGPMPTPGSGHGPMPAPGHGPVSGQGYEPMPGHGPVPAHGPMPGHGAAQGPMAGYGPGQGQGQGQGAGHGPGPGPRGRRAAGRRIGVPVAVGVSGVMVAALVGGVLWLAPGSDTPISASLVTASSSPSLTPSPSQSNKRPATTPPPRKTRRTTHKPTTPKQTTAAPSTASSKTAPPTRTPTPTRSTKKPAASARVSILAIDLSGGPGQSDAGGCYMPPVHFQSKVEATRSEVWVSYAWLVDGKSVLRTRSWVSEGEYTAFVTSGQYMLPAGRHTVTLKVTSPSATQKSVSFGVCALETW
ncbi:protein kinase [Nonomuraea phyllanthi]|uniref:serine/threonine-protein kinase n=1 Tax=Nonomuraea phyllanthi TaxID=2219224 RepID=UPI0012931104|nr:serine/threonine-protein kinase [Nonomuraea phyllanthi]QFY12247.1 protein kinase [Nonomuraea phyllanthi]